MNAAGGNRSFLQRGGHLVHSASSWGGAVPAWGDPREVQLCLRFVAGTLFSVRWPVYGVLFCLLKEPHKYGAGTPYNPKL